MVKGTHFLSQLCYYMLIQISHTLFSLVLPFLNPFFFGSYHLAVLLWRTTRSKIDGTTRCKNCDWAALENPKIDTLDTNF